MHRLFKPIFWTFLFLLMMLVIDQLLVQIPPVHPAHAAVCKFYQDFRSRLIDLSFGEKKVAPKTIEAVIEKEQQKAQKSTSEKGEKVVPQQAPSGTSKAASKTQAEKTPRYLYADGKGELHFVDSLDDVPDEYRGQAQPMGE